MFKTLFRSVTMKNRIESATSRLKTVNDELSTWDRSKFNSKEKDAEGLFLVEAKRFVARFPQPENLSYHAPDVETSKAPFFNSSTLHSGSSNFVPGLLAGYVVGHSMNSSPTFTTASASPSAEKEKEKEDITEEKEEKENDSTTESSGGGGGGGGWFSGFSSGGVDSDNSGSSDSGGGDGGGGSD